MPYTLYLLLRERNPRRLNSARRFWYAEQISVYSRSAMHWLANVICLKDARTTDRDRGQLTRPCGTPCRSFSTSNACSAARNRR